MSQRNCEFRNAIEFGDPVLVAKIGGLLGQGASVLSMVGSGLPEAICQTDISDDEMRSRGAPRRRTIRTLLMSCSRDWQRQVSQVPLWMISKPL